MGDGEVLPVPLNLVRAPRAMFEWLFDCCDKEEDTIEPPPVELDPYGNELNGDISGLASNGVEVTICGPYLILLNGTNIVFK
ncbi:hypothetical protein DPMN_178159 [Dreissena polymorpha]|uniref:Uncharacterized protein n=1 Tax=Dreissena polymorpha TaxID=45954 RepID=A0A9D4EDK9_DREPO|nr:hypothetical protein DPMN_178159 [Dreissena polymorpha]